MKDKKKKIAKEVANLTQEEVRARHFLDNLKKQFQGKSKIKLLPVALFRGGKIVASMLIEDIERNQLRTLSPDDLMYLRQFKEQLQGKKECFPQTK